MCVGARRLGRGPCAALLLLGLGLSTVTGLHCVGDTYPSNDRCCHECRPGNGMVSRCSRSQNTVCRPCGPGFYNDVVSSKPCKPCTWCNLRSGSERKQLCTATQDTVCRCRAGTQPLDSYKPGVGRAVAAILGLGLVLGLLGPLAILLALYLLRRDQRLPPDAHKPPGGGSFRTPIQEEQADAHSTLAKI
uniref:TNF receptor superfamily member 4 n=1 Tax=Homo sapiens TaxID=9606 RepID=A0A8V8TPP1_HUMAN